VARNNLAWIKGDITGDIYYDTFHLDSKDVQYLRLYLMIKGEIGSAAVKGLRVCIYIVHWPSWSLETFARAAGRV
jgi:hypothetical protein